MLENHKFNSELNYTVNNGTSNQPEASTFSIKQHFSEKNAQNIIAVNTFSDGQSVHVSLYSPTTSTSSASSCGSSLNTFKRISSIELESILDTTEN